MFGRDLSSSELVALHLALAAVAAGIWFSNGTLVGTAAGAGFGALMMGTKFSRLFKARWAGELAEAAAVVVVLVGWMVKQSLMGDEWEPSKVQRIMGPVMLFVFVAMLTWTSGHSDERGLPVEMKSEGEEDQTTHLPDEEAARLRPRVVLSVVVAVVLAGLVALSSAQPGIFGTQRQAVAAFAAHDLKAYRKKEGLEYVLAGFLQVHVDDIRQVGDREAVVQLSVDAPLLNEYFRGRDLTKRSATNAYFTLPGDQRRSIRLQGAVRLERSGLGWVVVSEDITAKVQRAWDQALSGELDQSKTRPTGEFSANMLGMEDASSGALSFAMGLAMLLVSIAVAIANPRRYFAPVAGAVFCCALIAAPTLLLTAF